MSSLHKVKLHGVRTIYCLRQRTLVDLSDKYVWLSKAGQQSIISLKEKVVEETEHTVFTLLTSYRSADTKRQFHFHLN